MKIELKKDMKKIVAVGLVAVMAIAVVMLVSRGNPGLVGRWQYTVSREMFMVFDADGTGYEERFDGATREVQHRFTWERDDEGTLRMTVEDEEALVVEYSIRGRELMLRMDGEEMVFRRQ